MSAGLWYVGIFSLIAGVALLVLWVMLLAGKRMPVDPEGRRHLRLHVAAEIATGELLCLSGFLLLLDHASGFAKLLSAAALGLLVYSLIASPGVHVERRDRATTTLFGALRILTIPAVILLFASA